MTTGILVPGGARILGAWGSDSRGVAHKRHLARGSDRPRQSFQKFQRANWQSQPTEYPANGSFDRAIHARSVSSRASEKNRYGQASRLISIGKLNASLRLHTRPITWSSSRSLQGSCDPGRSHLVEGFTLICFQRFSLPDVATRRYRWRDNRYTRGPSNPVLSY